MSEFPNECPNPEGCNWRSTINMTIEDENGENWEITFKGPRNSFMQSVEHNYALLSRIFEWREEETAPEMTKLLKRIL